ncbi:menaquinone biosynthetic enzyme MqnA/MqnD family protein [Chlamydia sp.]|uniref:menaquinone biosynthesis protein n=1 Tax=Chlamydia sp. TaxID=35827 RepID=UPI0025C1B0F9|nr:menaquinone biosynthetic enzyme MqnA/MqnD family protein [Chlamydia sp.]MBQ8498674.1 menaquinone biosynthetic enzyme MqnA/MqnD family protein [Chlamydia sp.]
MSRAFKHCLTVGCVRYVNALPFSIGLSRAPWISLHTDTPANLVPKLLSGDVDYALTSVIAKFSSPLYQVSSFGIAAYKKILSVNLHARPQFFSKESPRIAATKESLSSIMLVRILCENLWKIPFPSITSFSSEEVLSQAEHYDALLLIGDTALRHPVIPGFQTYDLAASWYDLTAKPFVFAGVLSLSSESLASLQEGFSSALHYFLDHKTEVYQKAAALLGLPVSLMQQYYTLCRYELSEEDFAGLQQFKSYYDRLPQQTEHPRYV